MSRRTFLKSAASAALVAALPASAARPIRAVAFDLFTLFDPREVDRRAVDVLGSLGGAFATTWKTRLFEYGWIRAAAGQYRPFDHLVRDALAYAADTHGVGATARARLESVFVELPLWPDSIEVLDELSQRRVVLAPLANYAPRMIEQLLRHAGIRDRFAALLSTDRARTYKPDPRAYALGQDVLGFGRGEIAFAAFGGWDAAGAHWYGYPTYWVNRLAVAAEEWVSPDATGPDLSSMAAWLATRA
jgi:2-haloacid dehalogenase